MTRRASNLLFVKRCLQTAQSLPRTNLTFVPKHDPPTPNDVEQLQNFVSSHFKIFVITGAGVSTESGIPDYRSAEVGLFATSSQRPMKIQEFLASAFARQRYWARNYVAYPRFSSVLPNVNHQTLKAWEEDGKLSTLCTQNVDGLHKKAGSRNLVELHGTSHKVKCITSCGYEVERADFQGTLAKINGDLRPVQGAQIRPDGDITIDEETQRKFRVPECPSCGGILKPDIVFFGDNVPRDRVQHLYDKLAESDSILVLGSTLQTFSAFRYILSGKQTGLPLAVVTLGNTRADEMADIKLNCRVGEIFPQISLSGL